MFVVVGIKMGGVEYVNAGAGAGDDTAVSPVDGLYIPPPPPQAGTQILSELQWAVVSPHVLYLSRHSPTNSQGALRHRVDDGVVCADTIATRCRWHNRTNGAWNFLVTILLMKGILL